MDTPGYPGTSHPGRFLSHSHCRPRRVIRRNRRISRFIPSAIQSCCCASAVESSFAQSAPLISYLLSELLQSANIRSHTRIMARRPLYPLIHVVVRVVVEGDRHVSHEYYYSYLFHYSHNCHTSSCIRNFLHRSISTFPPSPHDRPLPSTTPHPFSFARITGTTLALIRNVPVSPPRTPCDPLIIFPLHHFRASP